MKVKTIIATALISLASAMAFCGNPGTSRLGDLTDNDWVVTDGHTAATNSITDSYIESLGFRKGGSEGVVTNAVKDIIDSSFDGGTNAVNLVLTNTVVAATNDIAKLNAQKLDDDFDAMTNSVAFTNAVAHVSPPTDLSDYFTKEQSSTNATAMANAAIAAAGCVRTNEDGEIELPEYTYFTKDKIYRVMTGTLFFPWSTYYGKSPEADIAIRSQIPDVSGFVPYTGATNNVDLGENSVSASYTEPLSGNTYSSALDRHGVSASYTDSSSGDAYSAGLSGQGVQACYYDPVSGYNYSSSFSGRGVSASYIDTYSGDSYVAQLRLQQGTGAFAFEYYKNSYDNPYTVLFPTHTNGTLALVSQIEAATNGIPEAIVLKADKSDTFTKYESGTNATAKAKAEIEAAGLNYAVKSNSVGEAQVKSIRFTDAKSVKAKVWNEDTQREERVFERISGTHPLGYEWVSWAAFGAAAYGVSSTAFGYSASADGNHSTALGVGSVAGGDSSTALGYSASADGVSSTALGVGAKAAGVNSTALGVGSYVDGDSSTALGVEASANSDYSTALGCHALAGGVSSTAFGCSAWTGGKYSVAIGYAAGAFDNGAVVIGHAYDEEPGGWYYSHGTNTLNFAPTDDPKRIYFKEKTLDSMIGDATSGFVPYTGATRDIRLGAGQMIVLEKSDSSATLGRYAYYFDTDKIIKSDELSHSWSWFYPWSDDYDDAQSSNRFALVSQIEDATNGLVSAENPAFSNAVLEVGCVTTNLLHGKSYDASSDADMKRLLIDIGKALGATITNSIPSNPSIAIKMRIPEGGATIALGKISPTVNQTRDTTENKGTFSVDWGDGNIEDNLTETPQPHLYNSSGDVSINILGDVAKVEGYVDQSGTTNSIAVDFHNPSVNYVEYVDAEPESPMEFGDNAFSGSNAKSVYFSTNVVKIGNRCFYGCKYLKDVEFASPSRVMGIGNETFYNCTNIESIILPDSITSLGIRSFAYCTKLKSITLPEHIQSIGQDCFKALDGIGKIDVYCSLNRPKNYQSAWCFRNIHSPCEVYIHSPCTNVGYNAFYDVDGIKNITIGKSVRSLDVNAFAYCEGLTNVAFESNGMLEHIGKGAFSYSESLKELNVPEGVKYFGGAFIKTGLMASGLHLPDSIEYLGPLDAMSDKSTVPHFKLPENIKIIDGTFNGWRGLKDITIPKLIEEIGYASFNYCNSLTNIVFDDGCKNLSIIGQDSFRSIGIERFICPTNVQTIGSGAFSFVDGFRFNNTLKEIDLPSGITMIGWGAFNKLEKLQKITIRASVPPSCDNETLGFGTIPGSCQIFVPAASVNTYKTNKYWKSYSSQIQAM